MSAVAPAHCRSAVLRAVLFSLGLRIDFTVQRHKRAAGDAVRLVDTPGQYRPAQCGQNNIDPVIWSSPFNLLAHVKRSGWAASVIISGLPQLTLLHVYTFRSLFRSYWEQPMAKIDDRVGLL